MTFDTEMFSVLDSPRTVGYLKQPMPSAVDHEIRELVLQAARGLTFDQIVRAVPEYGDRTLGVFAERVASMAVRRHDPSDLRVGLIAMAIAMKAAGDWRDVLPVYSLLYRAAEKIGVDPAVEFAEANARLGGAADSLVEFAGREPWNRGIDVMGYVESSDQDGFKFVRTW